MTTKLYQFLAALIILLGLSYPIHAQQHSPSAVTLKKLDIVMVDTARRLARVDFSIHVPSAGTISVLLRSAQSSGSQEEHTALVAGQQSIVDSLHGESDFAQTWIVHIPTDGYSRLLDISLSFSRTDSGIPRPTDYENYSLFATVNKGSIEYRYTPDPKFCAPPIIVNPVVSGNGSHLLSNASVASSISISGRILTVAPTVLQNIDVGVPRVEVRFDWDYDNSATTHANPTYTNGTASVLTDDEGNFTFNRQADIPNGSPLWSTTKIRVYAIMSNEAAYNQTYGSGATFGQAGYTAAFTISPLSPNVPSASVDVSVDQLNGNVLRGCWRAREFYIHDLAIQGENDPPVVKYEFDPSSSSTVFADNPFNSYIRFHTVPRARTVYHEYGHHIHYRIGLRPKPTSNDPTSHNRQTISNDVFAIVEGWADFYAAACHSYWHMRTLATEREDDVTDITQIFIDGFRPSIPTNAGNSESAAASFFYNLWDDRAQRAVGSATSPVAPYLGDNDDLDNGAPFGHPRKWLMICLRQMTNTWVSNGQRVRRYPYLDGFRENYLPKVNSWYPITYDHHRESIDAMYTDFTSGADALRPATPTQLSVTGNKTSRTLYWNDHTGPATFDFITVTQRQSTPPILTDPFTIDQNNEVGFLVWMKRRGTEHIMDRQSEDWAQMDNIRDGRLDKNFSYVGAVITDVLSMTTNQVLTNGVYQYVVVAGSASGLSIPKARASINLLGPDIHDWDRDDDVTGVCDLIVPVGNGHSLTVKAEFPSDSTASFQWIATNKPAYISLTGTTTDSLKFSSNYTGSYQPGVAIPPFFVRCIVTHSNGTDTSAPYYPSFMPLDTASRFVSVVVDSSLIPDSNLIRGLDFVVQPGEDIISVRRLSVAPTYDSVFGYRILVKGLLGGTTSFAEARLLTIDHPPGTILGGSANCGFKIFAEGDSGLVEDSTGVYGLEELFLDSAFHSSDGDVTDYVRSHDSLWVDVDTQDSLMLFFQNPYLGDTSRYVVDTTLAIDSSRIYWVRDYVLELRGEYVPAGGVGNSVQIPVGIPGSIDLQRSSLGQSVPNPTNSVVEIPYTVGSDGTAVIMLYDAKGTVVRTLVDKPQKRGNYSITVDVSSLASGVYYYRLTLGGWTDVKSISLVK